MKNELLAPNGKPSKLNATQYELVRTPAFKKWFGDWENDPANASKVVDENGEPLVVYHGTNYQFFSFNQNKKSHYFAVDKKYADFVIDNYRGRNENSRIISCFLNIRKLQKVKFPIETNNIAFYLNEYKNNSLKEQNGGIYGLDDLEDNHLKEIKEKKINTYVYVVLNPNQIKLADGRNITFDLKNDDIRFAKGGKTKGDCYLVAGQIAMEIRSKKIDYKGTPYLVHAEVKHSTIEGLRFGHAFIEDDVFVYDFSNNREIIIPKQLYYYFGDINPKDKKKYRKYTFKQATKKMNDTGNFGCWDLDVEYNKGGSLEDKNTLKAKKIADEAQDKISHLECDGATRVLHYLFQEQNVKHVVKRGSVVFGKDDIPLHYWIELPDGSVVDYKSRMWLGEQVQQGIFKPNEKIQYIGKETDLKVSKFIYEILTMSTGGVIEKKIPDYLKMFLDL